MNRFRKDGRGEHGRGEHGRGRRSGRGPRRDKPESALPTNAPARWLGGFEAVVRALTDNPGEARELWIEHELKDERIGELVRRAKDLGLPVQYMARPELDRALKGGRHQGVALKTAFDPAGTFVEWLDALDDERKKGLVIVALDQIQDPHNLGAIARSALQLGARCLVAPERRSAPLTPAAVQASAGAALKIPIHRVVNLAQALARCKERGLWIYGADADGKEAWSAVLNTPCVLVIGSEGYGLRALVRASCDELLRVPQVAHGVGSLNASCAATALLYEIARQKAKPEA
ncbi:MAG: 23S rRNA (guanosine(2251)-2'-O)-methyltransferase RlmB [Elusimicrobia bacterium]|nr:23S rRNA (guanosine(2251)-2'-O)-methyltransferase RlmB [Elusimicrobiota bacterium]